MVDWVKREELAPNKSGTKELQRDLTAHEIEKCVPKLQSHKGAGADGIVNELIKFGGEGMAEITALVDNWAWKNEYVPSR